MALKSQTDSAARLKVLATSPDPKEAFGASRSLLGVLVASLGDPQRLELTGLCTHSSGWLARKGRELGWRVFSTFSGQHIPWHSCRNAALRYLRFAAESFYSTLKFLSILRVVSPDVVYVNTIEHAYTILASRVAGIPVIVHVREAPEYFAPKHRLDWLRVAILKSLTTSFICNSQSSAGSLRGVGVAAGRITVVHNAIDTEFFDSESIGAGELLSVREYSGKGPLVVCVSRLSKEKGILDLVRSFKLVLAELPGSKLVICGGDVSGNYFWKILAPELENLGLKESVLFRGQVADPRPWLASADVVVVPSHAESFGRVVLEAMALRKAVVATRVGGIPEVVEEGKTAILVPASDPVSLASAITKLLGDPALRDAMGRAGRLRAESVFSMSVNKAAISAVLCEAVRCHS